MTWQRNGVVVVVLHFVAGQLCGCVDAVITTLKNVKNRKFALGRCQNDRSKQQPEAANGLASPFKMARIVDDHNANY